MASPAWAVSQCDGGHDLEAGCERILRPYVAERLYLFGARPQGIPELSSLSWREYGRPSSSKLSNFGHSLTIHGPPRGDWTETCYRQPSTLEILAGEGSCFDTALLGVIFSHGQEGDQFPKTDRAFCHLDVRRMLAAAAFSRSLRLEGFLRQRIHAITMLS